jgi:hypothetical protein
MKRHTAWVIWFAVAILAGSAVSHGAVVLNSCSRRWSMA